MSGWLRGTALVLATVLALTATTAGVGVGATQATVGTDGTAAAAGGGTTPADDGTDLPPADDGTDLPPADEIYVEGDGDAVLVYREESDSAGKTRAEFGVDVGQSLMHALVVTDADTEEVRASGTALLTRERFDGNATLSFPRPDSLTDLSVDVEGERTAENAAFDATASATIDSEEARVAALADRASTTGNVTMTPTRFRAAGEFHADLANPLGVAQHQSFALTERDGTYVLDAAQNYTVSEFDRADWNSSSRARATLEERYGSLAEAYGGSAEVTLDAYEFTQVRESAYRLDVEYTITYRNIEEGLTRRLTTALAASERVDLDREQLDEIERRIKTLTVEEASVRYDQRAESIDASFRLDLNNYNEVVFAALEVAEATHTKNDSISTDLSRFRKTFEAQQAASLERRLTFQAGVEATSRTTSSFEAEAHYRTKHWADYVEELERRGIEQPAITYELHARTEGERINASAAIEISQKELVDRLTDAVFEATAGNGGTGGTDGAKKFVERFRQAGFQRARTDVSLRDGRVRLEAGAAFDNASELRAAMVESGQVPRFASIVGRTDNETLRTYVRVRNVVGANASESDVRALPYVNEDTTVHLAGTWDREFPSVDTETAREFLGLTPTPTPGGGTGPGGQNGTTGGDAGTEGSIPGFGVPVAIVALLAALLLGRR